MKKVRKAGTRLEANLGRVGMAWYRPEQWQPLRQAFVDPDVLEATHAEWFEFATTKFNELEAVGVRVFKVDVDIEELIGWCRDQGLSVDDESAAAFAAHKVQRMLNTPREF